MTQKPASKLTQYQIALAKLIAASGDFEEALNAGDALFVALSRRRVEEAARAFTNSTLELETENAQNSG